MCDRYLCPLKCQSGDDAALKERPVRGTTASVCIDQDQKSTLEINKITNFSNLHDFKLI